jgi:hypothetical protein
MATTHVARTLAIHRQEGKGGVIEDRAPGEESSQDFPAGAPLVYDATTKEIEVWAGTTDATKIIGIATAHSSGTAGTKVSYYEANDYNLFEGTLINNATAYVLLGTEVGVAYSLIASGDIWLIDIADVTTKKVEVVGLISAVGDTNPRVIFRFIGGMQSRALQS